MVAFVGAAINRWFGWSKKERTILIGDDPRMRLLAAELGAMEKSVTLMKSSVDGDTPAPGVNLLFASEPWENALAIAGAESATSVIASTTDNDLNQQLCEIARKQFHVTTTIMRLGLVSGVTSWAKSTETGIARTNWPDVVRTIIGAISPSPLLARLMRLTDRDQIADLELRSPAFAGLSVEEWSPRHCEVLALTRRGEALEMSDGIRLELADVVTLIGPSDALNKVRESFASL